MKTHAFVNSYDLAFDANCSVCGGKDRGAIHSPFRQAKANDTARSELSFDGCGINGPDEYRSRIVTFHDLNGAAKKYGPLFAAAPELLAALRSLLPLAAHTSPEDVSVHTARTLIAKVTGGNTP